MSVDPEPAEIRELQADDDLPPEQPASPEKRVLVDIVDEEEVMNEEYAEDTYEDSFENQILNMNLFYKKAEKSKQSGEAELFEIGKGVVQERLDRLGEGLLKRQNDKKDRKAKMSSKGVQQ